MAIATMYVDLRERDGYSVDGVQLSCHASTRKGTACQRIPLPGRASVDGIAEVFNAFNSPNWTITTDESSRQYLQRTSGLNRTAQFGFRFTF